MTASASLFTIVLAAGKGRRMRNRYMHKVCFEIAGVPTIVRSLDTFNRLGAVQNVVVVGEMAGQVVETVGERFSNVVFAYQPHALGTGDAARYGLKALAPVADSARVLVVAGDKIIDLPILSRLLTEFDARPTDLSLLVSPAEHGGESAGRILLDEAGRPAAIAEFADIRLRACRAMLRQRLADLAEPMTMAQLRELIAEPGVKPLPLDKIFGAELGAALDAMPSNDPLNGARLLQSLEEMPTEFTIGVPPHRIAASEAFEAPLRNESIYLARKAVLDYGLQHLAADNAQGELYLTDAIGAILDARDDDGLRFRAAYVAASSPHDIMSYNNPEELSRITD